MTMVVAITKVPWSSNRDIARVRRRGGGSGGRVLPLRAHRCDRSRSRNCSAASHLVVAVVEERPILFSWQQLRR